MPVQNRVTLKSYFETGDQPTESNFEDLIDSLLLVSGDTTTGAIVLNADPTNVLEAATKGYVDNLVTGLSWKQSVVTATTNNITLSGTQTIDGVAVLAGDRVLVKNQTTATENGIYLVDAGAWTRAGDNNTGAEIAATTVLSEGGTVNGGTQWNCSNSSITLGSTNITFVQIAGAGVYTNGTGIALSGNTFSIDSNVATLTGSQTLTNKSGDISQWTNNIGYLTSATGVTTVNGSSGAISNIALTTGTLAQFAATSSAQLLSLISDETGTGSLVFGTSPNFTTQITTPLINIPSIGTGIDLYNTTDQTTNYERLRINKSSDTYRIESQVGGTGTIRDIIISVGSSSRMFIMRNSAAGNGMYTFSGTTGSTGTSALGISNTFSSTSGINSALGVLPTINQSSAAGYRALWISPYQQATGSGTKYLIDAGTNSAADGGGTHTARFLLDNAGNTIIGTVPITGVSLLINKGITGASTSYGVQSAGSVQSDVTTASRGFNSILNTQATSFTLPEHTHFFASQGSIGAGSTVTAQMGFLASSSLNAATTNYGFYSNLAASGTSAWGFYANGTAPNYFAGHVSIGRVSTSVRLTVCSTSEQTRIEYDANNYLSTLIGSTGNTTFSLTGTNPEFSFSQIVRFPGGFATASSGANSNLFSAANVSGSGTWANTNSNILFGGASQVSFRNLSRGSTQTTININDSYASFLIGAQGFTEAISGTHTIGAQLVVKPISITNSTATTTNTASVYIEDAGTAGTNNYALWSDAGINRLDGNTGFGSVTNPNSTVQISGSLSLPYTSQTAAYSILATDYTIDCTTGSFTVTLPTASGITGRIYIIKNSGTGTITIATTSSQTIDANTTKSLSIQYSGYAVQSNGNNWITIAAF